MFHVKPEKVPSLSHVTKATAGMELGGLSANRQKQCSHYLTDTMCAVDLSFWGVPRFAYSFFFAWNLKRQDFLVVSPAGDVHPS